MPRIPVLRVHRATNQAFVRIAGKFHYLGVSGSPQVFERYAALLATLDDTAPTPTPTPARQRRTPPATTPKWMTLAELAHRFLLATMETHGDRHTLAYEARYVASALIEGHAGLRVHEFGPVAFKRVRARIVASGKSRVWTNRMMAAVRRCFKWGIGEELVPADRLEALKAVNGLRRGDAPEAPPRHAANPAAVEATLAYLDRMGDDGAARLVRFLRATGCRPSEGCRARWGEMHLADSLPRYTPANHKTAHHGIERVVPLNRDALAAIGGGLRIPLPDAFVFTNTKGEPFTANSLLLAIRRGVKATGCANWSPYELRHLAATRALAATGNEAAAAAMLGHTPGSRIIQRYSRDRFELAAHAARAIEGAA
ncbi:MAG: site-specific integrase [Planctomycetota bacterium]|nr:site-specific integrase [Planctomycetota bacterium]